MRPNKRLKLAARVDYVMNLSSARRSLSAIRWPPTVHYRVISQQPLENAQRRTMTARLRTAIIAAMAAFWVPAVAAGQQSSVDGLRRRIDSLEQRVADLEQRVRVLETVIKSEPSHGRPLPTSSRWKDIANWRQLRIGMTMDAARALLGEPEKVDVLSGITLWYWDYSSASNTYLRFDQRGRLDAWSEPAR